MNRKLHNSMLAFSAAGVMLALTLMASGPAPSVQDAPATLAAVVVHAPDSDADAFERNIEARARQPAADRGQSVALGDTIATGGRLAATLSSEPERGAAA